MHTQLDRFDFTYRTSLAGDQTEEVVAVEDSEVLHLSSSTHLAHVAASVRLRLWLTYSS